jgi:hypothetical protein
LLITLLSDRAAKKNAARSEAARKGGQEGRQWALLAALGPHLNEVEHELVIQDNQLGKQIAAGFEDNLQVSEGVHRSRQRLPFEPDVECFSRLIQAFVETFPLANEALKYFVSLEGIGICGAPQLTLHRF